MVVKNAEHITLLERALAAQESLRPTLGDAAVEAAITAIRAQLDALRGEQAERRQVTVMFCDLVGSTALLGRLDPEDFREIIGAYQEACGQAVLRHGGYVAKFLGDGVLVYFGYPQAHEDDARRAVRAGLAVLGAVRSLQTPVTVRIGIHTGLVVAGEMTGGDQREATAIVGETPNLAARVPRAT
jgi:class 3 adenylate cyclase